MQQIEKDYRYVDLSKLTDDEKKELISECGFDVVEIPPLPSRRELNCHLYTMEGINHFLEIYLGSTVELTLDHSGKSALLLSKGNEIESFYHSATELLDDKHEDMQRVRFELVDREGANLGNIESDRFATLDEIIDRMSIYWDDYGIKFTETELKSYRVVLELTAYIDAVDETAAERMVSNALYPSILGASKNFEWTDVTTEELD
jgi:hypothetical protein